VVDQDFFAALLHRLRGPLNVIAGWTGVLRTGQATPEMLRQAADAIERSCRGQAELVATVVELWALSEGAGKLEPVPVDLRDCLRAAVDAARERAHGREIAVEGALGAPLEVLGDRGRLVRAMALLLRHAVERSAAGDTVRARVDADATSALVEVTDAGPGVDARDVPFLFDRLRPAAPSAGHSPDVPHGQVNLDLAVTSHIAALHQGTLVARAAPAGGLTITLTLPRG
jgi:two-component system sensor histidine kinase BaeS